MKSRLILMIFVSAFCLVLGFLFLLKYPQNSLIRVSGNIDNIYLSKSKCIIVLGRFWIDYRGDCVFSRKTRIRVVGRVKGSVTDRFLGRLWLDSAELVILDNESVSSIYGGKFTVFLNRIRENLMNVYRRYLPVPESGLVAGIILGVKNDIGQELYDLMVKSGTIHIAVASGYNIMLVGGTAISICFWFIKRKWASVLALMVMILYAFEAGGEPPVLRAVIMATAIFGSAIVGRKVVSWWVLLITGWFLILIKPLLILDVSFQLSMMASVGLMVVEPKIRKLLQPNFEKLSGFLSGSGILTSVSTMVTTAPIIWWHFGRMTWIGVLSNILILPFIPILMIFGVAMQVFPGVFAWPTYVIAHWMVGVIRFFGM